MRLLLFYQLLVMPYVLTGLVTMLKIVKIVDVTPSTLCRALNGLHPFGVDVQVVR